jgi:hypothetical protein
MKKVKGATIGLVALTISWYGLLRAGTVRYDVVNWAVGAAISESEGYCGSLEIAPEELGFCVQTRIGNWRNYWGGVYGYFVERDAYCTQYIILCAETHFGFYYYTFDWVDTTGAIVDTLFSLMSS